MKLTTYEICRMMDLSAVQAENDDNYIRDLVTAAKKYRCVAVFVLPSHLTFARELLGNEPDIVTGAVVGYPSGGESTHSKIQQTLEQLEQGCREFDMVINIGKLLSGRHAEVQEDIHAVVQAAGGLPVKVILECHYLSNDLIRTACDLAIMAGASFVKTGTGWAPTGATLERVAVMKAHVASAIQIKAAGGIRDLDTLVELYRRGAVRFGVGLKVALKILEQASALPGGETEIASYLPLFGGHAEPVEATASY